ncbi:hypothetical protein D3C78_914180 [compost metagenome]
MSFITEEGRKRLERVAVWLENGAKHIVVEKDGTPVGIISGFDMKEGIVRDDCGTVCCIAGAVCQFEDFDGDAQMGHPVVSFHADVFPTAVKLLGISQKDARALFTPRLDYNDASLSEELTRQWGMIYPEAAARVIRHYLATGEVDWDKFFEWEGEEE